MNFDNLKNEDFLIKVLIAIVVAVLLPVLWPIIMAAIGLFLVLVLFDASQGGKTLDNFAERIAYWFKKQGG